MSSFLGGASPGGSSAILFCVGRFLRRVLSTDDTTQAVKATRRQISVSRKSVVSRQTF